MAIKITVSGEETQERVDSTPVAEIELQLRRSMNGDYYISDHSDIDIIIMKEKQKETDE